MNFVSDSCVPCGTVRTNVDIANQTTHHKFLSDMTISLSRTQSKTYLSTIVPITVGNVQVRNNVLYSK